MMPLRPDYLLAIIQKPLQCRMEGIYGDYFTGKEKKLQAKMFYHPNSSRITERLSNCVYVLHSRMRFFIAHKLTDLGHLAL